MTPSSITNKGPGQGQVGRQQAGSAQDQSEKTRTGRGGGGSPPGQAGDSVSLSGTRKSDRAATPIATEQASETLLLVRGAILQDSRAAIAGQANVDALVAQEVLTGG